MLVKVQFGQSNPVAGRGKLLGVADGWEYWKFGGDVFRNRAGDRGYMLPEGIPATARWESTIERYEARQHNPVDEFSTAAASLAGRRVGARRKSAGGALPFGAFNSWLDQHRSQLSEEPLGREVAAWRKAFMDGVRQRNPKGAADVTDRAKRYRAQKNVTGPKKCVLCGSRSDLGVMHLDGNEGHGEPANLAWGCRSCNQLLSHGFKRAGAGKRTAQYNPSKGVPTFGQYLWAVKHQQHSGDHGEYGAVIHATPKSVRTEYALRIAGLKAKAGTGGRRGGSADAVPF